MSARPVLVALATVAAALSTTHAAAQGHPTKPITRVVPFAAGGPTDVVAPSPRAAMTRSLGHAVIG